jgi:uncharacterized membrane protein YccC
MKADYRHGIITAVACWAATLAAFAMDLGNPWWATMTAWVIASPDPTKIWQKGALRIGGTIVGCVFGYALAAVSNDSPFAQLGALFVVMAVGTYLRFRSEYEYAWTLGTVSALLLISVSLDAPGTLYQAAHYRASEIICGVVSATLCPLLLRPLLRLADPAARAEHFSATLHGDHSEILRVAVVGGVTVVSIAIIWAFFALPSLSQSMITAVIVLNRDVATTRHRAQFRVVGCMLGGAVGLLCIVFVADSFVVWSIMLLLGIAGFAKLHLSDHRWAYVGTQGGIAFIMAMVSGSGPPDSVLPVVNRLTGITVGIIVMLGVAAAAQLFPAGSALPKLQRAGH